MQMNRYGFAMAKDAISRSTNPLGATRNGYFSKAAARLPLFHCYLVTLGELLYAVGIP